MSRLAPDGIDADVVVLAALRANDVSAFEERPGDWLTRLPCVILTPLPGVGAGVGGHEHRDYLFQCWAGSRKAARDLALDVRVALRQAWLDANQHINYVGTGALPTPTPTGRSDTWRFDVLVTVGVR